MSQRDVRKLPGFPTDATQVLRGDRSWGAVDNSDVIGQRVFDPHSSAYDAPTDGTTDSTIALQATLSAASAFASVASVRPVVQLRSGLTYRIATGLTMPSNVELDLNGARLLADDTANETLALNASYTATSSALTADLVEGDVAVTPTTTTGFAAGQIVYISGNDINLGTWVTRITSVSGGNLNLDEPAPFGMTVAGHAVAVTRISTLARNVYIHDGVIETNTSAPTLKKYHLTARRFEDVTIENVVTRYARAVAASGIYAQVGRNLIVKNCLVEGVQANDTALAINLEAVTGADVDGNHVRDSSTAISLSGCPYSVVRGNRCFGRPSSPGRGIKLLASSNHSSCKGNVIANFANTHTGIHVIDSSHVEIEGNALKNVGAGINVSSSIDERSKHVKIIGNDISNVTGTGNSGIVLGSLPAAVAAYHVVANNTIEKVAVYGIYVGVSDSLILGNQIKDWNQLAAASIHGIFPTSSCARNAIADNHGSRTSGGGSGNFINTSAASGNYVFDNTYEGSVGVVLDTEDEALQRTAANVWDLYNIALKGVRQAASDVILSAQVQGDSAHRLRLRADGVIFWGSGSALDSMNLSRSAANVLRLSGGKFGADSGVFVNTAVTVGMQSGAGSPEGAVSAPVGNVYLRTDGGAVTSFYVKESGSGNTGWVAK